jgi:hypothetical protein
MATPTETCALAVAGASARQVRSAVALSIHLNPRILMPRLLNVLEAVIGFVHCINFESNVQGAMEKRPCAIGCRIRKRCTPTG